MAGVRYRARQLSASLHPTIPVHAPLVFDLIDRWKERSVGAVHVLCGTAGWQHVYAHGRRMRRRRKSGGWSAFRCRRTAPGAMAVPEEETNPIFPMTLDLRCRRRATKPVERESRAMTVDLHQTPLRYGARLRRVVGRRRDSAAALGAPDGVAAGRSARRSWRGAGRAPNGAFARTESPTTSTAIRWARTGRGRSTLFRC